MTDLTHTGSLVHTYHYFTLRTDILDRDSVGGDFAFPRAVFKVTLYADVRLFLGVCVSTLPMLRRGTKIKVLSASWSERMDSSEARQIPTSIIHQLETLNGWL